MTSIDTNISNYTLSELIAIARIDSMEPDEIIEKTNKEIKRFKHSKPEISVFFKQQPHPRACTENIDLYV